ncbi:hypothetical protein FYJ85_13700 [Victivallaceae bacterium BBE-744-WT-12]|uniref:Uncharacterized protein n=1 Tax=Victivallis lenta TaxID=2606640 RepID=A0A844G4N4_9BACT|nr:hypothetical protein [Victivallis lenta]MST98093.1 hypothetical protein [Victivallis lenta]
MKKIHIFPERFTKNGKRAILSGYSAEPFRIRIFRACARFRHCGARAAGRRVDTEMKDRS